MYLEWFRSLPNCWAVYNKYMDVSVPHFIHEQDAETQETIFQLFYLAEQE